MRVFSVGNTGVLVRINATDSERTLIAEPANSKCELAGPLWLNSLK
jgi:hypothetical protein